MEIKSARYTHNQRSQKKRKGGRIVAVLLVLLVLISTSGYTAAALTKEVPSLLAAPTQIETIQAEPVVLSWPTNGQAAVGSLEDGLLATSTTDQQAKPIASMTKLVTALAVVAKAPIELNQTNLVKPKSYIKIADLVSSCFQIFQFTQ